MKVAIGPSSFADLDKTPIKILEEAGLEIVPNPFGRRLTEEEIIKHLSGVDGLIAGLEPLNSKVLEAHPQLKAIARVGIGITNVDLQRAKELGVKVSNTPDGPTYAVAEMTITAMLSLGREILSMNEALHNSKWTKVIGMGLNSTKILIIGYGRIGRKVSELLQGFGPEVYVFDPYIQEKNLQYNEKLISLDEGLKIADMITLHAAGVDEIIGEKEFDIMKQGVILLNSARGELINENALINALESKKVKAAWLDAFWQEPYSGKLTQYSQVLLTPHAGTYTEQCRSSMEIAAVNNLLRDLGVK